MIIDLLQNTMSYNVKLAQLIGLNNAVYISALLNLLAKNVSDKGIGSNDYFKLEPKYIVKLTGISSKDQANLDLTLEKFKILEFNSPRDKVKINIGLIVEMISESDRTTQANIKEIFKPKEETQATKSLNKRQIICNSLKNGIICSNEELLNAYKDWVDGVYANPTGFLSKKAIEIFQDTINKFTQGDLDMALELINIATVSGYRDATWAINIYNQRHPKTNTQPKQQLNINLNNKETF